MDQRSQAASAAREPEARTEVPAWLSPLCRCLVAAHPSGETLSQLQRVVCAALATGARPFEAVVGTPQKRYGARLTFTPGKGPDREAIARALSDTFGFSAHPWGLPSWIGVRAKPEGVLVKAYHRPAPGRGRLLLPPALACFAEDLEPFMIAEDRGAEEVYLRLRRAAAWPAFAEACAQAVDAPLPAFSPRPRPAEGGFALSLKTREGAIEALSLYAHERSLPDDDAIREAWKQGMSEDEARAYEQALAGARSTRRLLRGSLHAVLAWTVEAEGTAHRAASLRVANPQTIAEDALKEAQPERPSCS